MKKIATIILLTVSTTSFGQRTVQFADTISNAYNITNNFKYEYRNIFTN